MLNILLSGTVAWYSAALNTLSTYVPLTLDFRGINNMNVICNMSQGCKVAHISLPGCVDNTLLDIFLVSGLAGNWEHYISPVIHELVVLHAELLDYLTL